MTLVQNHRPPLSGNSLKHFIYLLLILNACYIHTTHVSAQTKPFKVAILLPFGTSSINYDTSGNVIGKLPSTAQMAIQYYKGVMLALDSLSRSGYKITSNIYDTNGDTLVLQSILDKAEMPDMDLIIGPFFIDELRKASRFCERFKIPLISPYSTTTSFIKSNPYYILSKPTLSSHCKALYDYMEMKFNPSRIIMLYTNTDQDKNYAALFEQAWKQSALKPSLYKLTDSTKVTYRQVDLYLMPGENNIIIIPSTNETFISKMTAKLDSLSATYNITLIGMPQWRESQTLKVNQLSRLNCIISHYSLLNKSSDAYKKLAVTYANRYNAAITDYAIDGYNDAFYFIKTLSDKRFTAEYNFPQLDMICKQMILVPQSKLSNTIAATADYYENKFVKILQYKNGRLEELP